jgi:predicted dehydrogenase
MTAGKPLGVGFVGAGMVGQVAHLANYVANPACKVVALAELRPDLGRQAAERHGVPKLYGSHRELLADPEVEAVVVVTRPHAHGPIVLDALEAGRHVFSEKPMAHTVEQAERLVAAAQNRKLTYAVGFMKRHDAGVQRAKAALDALRASGELGKLLLMRAWMHGGDFRSGTQDFVMTKETRPDGLSTWPSAPDWIPPDTKQDYAWFLNVFLHDLNMLRFLAGGNAKVQAVDFSRSNGRLALLDFGAFPAALEMAEVASQGWHEGVEAVFERGRLSVHLASPMRRDAPARVELERPDAPAETLASEAPGSWAFRRQAEAFVADARAARTPLASAADAVDDLRLAEALWRRHLGVA